MGTVRGQTVNIDFEGLAEGTAIAAQFAPGVTFSLGDDGLGGTPQIATANTGSTIGFVGSSGDDAPAASGVNSLTPGLAGGPCPCLPSLRMDFNPPVSSVTLFILDFDANPGDPLEVIAFDSSGSVVDLAFVTSLGFPGGDGVAQSVAVSASGIDHVIVDFAGPGVHDNGLAIDDLSFVVAPGSVVEFEDGVGDLQGAGYVEDGLVFNQASNFGMFVDIVDADGDGDNEILFEATGTAGLEVREPGADFDLDSLDIEICNDCLLAITAFHVVGAPSPVSQVVLFHPPPGAVSLGWTDIEELVIFHGGAGRGEFSVDNFAHFLS